MLTKPQRNKNQNKREEREVDYASKHAEESQEPFLPLDLVVLGNVQSIRNKIDELQACAKYFF